MLSSAGPGLCHGGNYARKEAARRVIPDAVIDRPKGYFPMPALKYIQGEYLDFVTDILHDPRAVGRRLFRQDSISSGSWPNPGSMSPR